MRSFLFVFFFCFIFAQASSAEPCKKFQEYTVLPTHESGKDKSFTEFKKKLDQAIQSKDIKFLEKIVDPDIKFSFGADSGKKGFWTEWKLDKNPEKSEIWTTLANTLRLGIVRDETNQFISPTIFSKFPDKLDAFEYTWASGKNVNVREKPDVQSKIIDTISYQIVQLDSKEAIQSGTCSWQKVCLASGKSGYICDTYLRSSVDYRAFFTLKNKDWKLTIFVAGD
ncbi:SH3 domain-containing protein [Leptospira sarikeiensis]|uniref:SH3 domain-containing protein n=1 Tax=Leptospira sarikeiensis TaxID=2484943 RepID=UPI001FE58A32|nr:SH3 domain-containing protein [Leptospira sarikeiensis]